MPTSIAPSLDGQVSRINTASAYEGVTYRPVDRCLMRTIHLVREASMTVEHVDIIAHEAGLHQLMKGATVRRVLPAFSKLYILDSECFIKLRPLKEDFAINRRVQGQ